MSNSFFDDARDAFASVSAAEDGLACEALIVTACIYSDEEFVVVSVSRSEDGGTYVVEADELHDLISEDMFALFDELSEQHGVVFDDDFTVLKRATKKKLAAAIRSVAAAALAASRALREEQAGGA